MRVDQDKATAKREKEERKAAQRAEKEEAKTRKSMDQRKSREYKRDDATAVAGGATLGQVADKVKNDDEPVRDESFDEPKTRDVEPIKTKDNEKSSRGMFDRIASRLKKHGGEEKKTTTENREVPVTHEETAASDEPKHDNDTEMSLAGAAALSGGVVAGAVMSSQAVPEKDSASTRDIVSKNDGTAAGGSFQDDTLTEQQSVPDPTFERLPKDDAVLPGTSTLPIGNTAPSGVVAPPPDGYEIPPPLGAEQEHAPVRWIDTASDLSGELSSDVEDTAPAREVPTITTSESTTAAPALATAGHQPVANKQDDSDAEHNVSDDEWGVSKAGKRIAATAGIAALGGIIAAGALGAERRRRQEEEAEREGTSQRVVSGVSTTNGEDDDAAQRPAHYPVASAEHTGNYTLAGPATLAPGRPDLERHISTIQDSSSSDGDDELDSSDDEDEPVVGTATTGRAVEQPVQTYRHVERSEEEPAKDRALMIDPTPAPTKAEEVRSAPVRQERSAPMVTTSIPSATLDMPRENEQGNIVLEKDNVERLAAADAASAAPSPAVKTGPATHHDPQESEKDKKGVRGFFSKFRGKSKGEKKLHKEPPKSERSTAAASSSKPVATNAKTDDILTPVTTTSAGREAEGQHVGTDGPIGDSSRVGGSSGDADPRPTSPSSFRRYDNQSRDLDDVSSSGADEDDLSRGRGGGRLAAKLGLSKGKGATSAKDTATAGPVDQSISNDEQFEEARDRFDESLAPPPAFPGQKSESPNRTTRFSEDL